MLGGGQCLAVAGGQSVARSARFSVRETTLSYLTKNEKNRPKLEANALFGASRW
jgi:hypothetical protein